MFTRHSERLVLRAWLLVALLLLASVPTRARAWGDEGHEIVSLIARALLTPAIRKQVDALLALDEDPLTEHDIASEATWADHLREANADGARTRTRQWHFVDIELQNPVLTEACFGRPKLPPGMLASQGPAAACVVDKIDQFAAELAARDIPPEERLLALKYVLHFVGDVHQPLHASDDFNRGGNDIRVSAEGFRAGNLHHFWDTEFVHRLGSDPASVAALLLASLSPADRRRWSAGYPADWALESFELAQRDAYGLLPAPTRRGTYRLDAAYVDAAVRDVRLQLTKAGVRLAVLLDRSLRPH